MAPQRDVGPPNEDEFTLIVDEHDQPEPNLEETLRHAQAASGADVVTCGVRVGGKEQLFLGDAGGLGLIDNHYGAAALVRRSLIGDAQEAMWPRLARLVTGGAQIVSVPRALVERSKEITQSPADALQVARRFEERLPPALRSLARLAAGLAAADAAGAPPRPSRLRRLVERMTRR
jgi:hypothetical protein